MTEHPDIAALAQVMAPTFGVDEALDWPSVEERLDCQLPSDYKAFMSLYGGGGIDDLLSVLLLCTRTASNGIPVPSRTRSRAPAPRGSTLPRSGAPTSTRLTSSPGARHPDPISCAGSPLTPTPTTGRSLSAAGTPTSAGPCSTAAWPDSSCGSSPLTSPLVP